MTVVDRTTPETPELIQLPQEGYAVYYRDDKHWYQRVNDKGLPGTRYPSPSTICKYIDPNPDSLMRWAGRLQVQGVARLVGAGESIPADHHLLMQKLEVYGLTWEQIRDAKATVGTDVHRDVFQALAEGVIPDLGDRPANQVGYGQAAIRFWRRLRPEPTHVEQTVLSLTYEYAGRFDLRAHVRLDQLLDTCPQVVKAWGIKRDETWLIDAKTSNYVGRNAHVQVAGYELAAEECGVGGSDRRVILQLCDDGTFRLYDSQAHAEDFLAALAIHERAKGIDRLCAAAKKAERVVDL